ncbi:hypothetical protein C2G38_2200736 [Gigaspora rosea]|uniref:Uncharacterized protein n=1 Tax=Gigaspora rosea TaxID=44941 RepID=A0A397UYW8_9GLOM|nr:hypothetical protein C2G38_2200736 [Gigaspora rosea]
MESFQATAPFLRTINQLQRYIRGFYVATLYVTDTTIEFFNAQGDRVEVNFAPDLANGSSEGSQVPLFHEDLQRIGYLAIELEKIMLLQHYYLLGERLAMYNWNAYAKQEMMNRFTANKFKGAWRITCRVFSLYQTRGVHNLLISHHLSANTLLVMTKEGFTSLFEEARRSHEEEIEFLIINNYS